MIKLKIKHMLDFLNKETAITTVATITSITTIASITAVTRIR